MPGQRSPATGGSREDRVVRLTGIAGRLRQSPDTPPKETVGSSDEGQPRPETQLARGCVVPSLRFLIRKPQPPSSPERSA